ncbi:hypothetical protein N5C41_02900 [Pseudomonas sp. GD03985]|nr:MULTISPECIES: hypothetical protein [unclassified Pseudomonas]MDH0894380.1 hypothetical protein [Pseudomonas sp. GD03875]MDH1063325.1 hypothetical protein [Pseudomonas sp. GD03985]
MWVLTGEGERPQLARDEMELLSLYRGASIQLRAAAVAALSSGAAAAKMHKQTAGVEPQPKRAKKQVFRGSVGQVVEGSITNEAGVSFNFGVDKKE